MPVVRPHADPKGNGGIEGETGTMVDAGKVEDELWDIGRFGLGMRV